jgi:hypothetical protein
MRPPCIACLNKLSWGNRFSALLLLCVATAIASPAQNLRQAAQPRQACGLGIRWNEEESGLPSIWTRRGTGDVFDVSYPTARVTTVNTVTASGSKVYIIRTNGSDGNVCSYEGTVGPDGGTITGTYKCLNGSAAWKATVICDSASASASSPHQGQIRDNSSSDVKKNAAATEQIATDTAPAIGKADDKPGHETKVAAKDTAKVTEKVAKKTGTPVNKGAEDMGHNTGDTAKPQ